MRGRGPAGGVELLRARFAGRAFARHRHDTYAIGVTEVGVQAFDYRGRVERSRPGQVVVLHPDEPHDGRPGAEGGFGYRIVYVEPARIADAVRAISGPPDAAAVRARAGLAQPDAGARGRGRVPIAAASRWRSTRWCCGWPRACSRRPRGPPPGRRAASTSAALARARALLDGRPARRAVGRARGGHAG